MKGEISLFINSEMDVLNAREKGRWLAGQIGFRGSELTLLATLISELARKAVSLNCKASVLIQSIQLGARKGIAISVSENLVNTYDGPRADPGPGARSQLSRDNRLLMLAGRHVADEFEVRPTAQRGAVVRVVKWL